MVQALRALAAIVVVGAILSGLLFPGTALAHERRKLGKYELVVGFLDEPALVGQPNAVSLTVTNAETNQPVEGLQQTLDAEVAYGDKTMPVSLRARFRTPGAYQADFIPTRAGTYVFRFFGEIEGQKVDERFKSGPGAFNDVEGVEQLQFPEKAPVASELVSRLQQAEASSRDARNMALALGGAAVALGAAGVVLGLVSLRGRAGPAAAGPVKAREKRERR